jgi:integrase
LGNRSPHRTAAGGTGTLTERRMTRTDALRMIWRRAAAADIETELGCHSFRPTGITAYLQNSSLLEHAQQMAAHESARTTKLYDRRNDKVTLDERSPAKCPAIWGCQSQTGQDD